MAKRLSSDILTGFEDATGNWHEAPQETLAALAAAMGQPPRNAQGSLIVARRGLPRPLRHSAQVTRGDGAVLSFDKALPGNLPAGYHTLRYLDQERDTKLIVSPGVCHLPERLRIWGWSR